MQLLFHGFLAVHLHHEGIETFHIINASPSLRKTPSYDQFWAGLMARQGRQAGTKAMIDLLQLGRDYGQRRLRAAIEQALALGCTDRAAVRHLVTARDHERVLPVMLEVGALARFERPLPDVTPYDQLLLVGGER